MNLRIGEGWDVHALVAGSAQNFKVTYPEDFALAEAVLLARQQGQNA
jgi:2-C-methyl-D-erythritol 4-phosphate cytidylyltransferase